MPRLSAAPAPVRTEVTVSLLRAMVTAIGAVSLFILMRSEGSPVSLGSGVVVLSVVAVGSLISVVPLVRLRTVAQAQRAAICLTVVDLAICTGYAWHFADRPGAGSAYPAFVLIMGPVRWGWRGMAYTGVPIAIVATLWPQQTLSGTTYNVGQIWFLSALFSISTAAITTVTRRSNARLRQAQDQFQVAFEHASIGMALLDDLGTIVKANRSLSQLLGIDEERVLGSRLVDYVEGEHAQRLSRTLAMLSQHRPATRLEVRLSRPDSEPRWGLVAASWVKGGDSVPARVVLQVENITERKEAEVRMSYLANHDNLTGLPNRGLLRSCLAAAIERGDHVGVLFLDLDRFKVIN
ncbi:MAG: PAS domain S-box protein, partial [Mycobacteriales bacterium]